MSIRTAYENVVTNVQVVGGSLMLSMLTCDLAAVAYGAGETREGVTATAMTLALGFAAFDGARMYDQQENAANAVPQNPPQ